MKVSIEASLRTRNKSPKTISTQKIIDRFVYRKKGGRIPSWGAFLGSLAAHFMLFVILAFSLSSLYDINLELVKDRPDVIHILNLFPQTENIKPKNSPETEFIQNIIQHNLSMTQPVALNRGDTSGVDKWDWRVTAEREIISERKIEYQQKPAYANSLPILSRRVSYEDSPSSILKTKEKVLIDVGLPTGNMTNYPKFTLKGHILPDVKKAFLTVNDDTKLLELKADSFNTKIKLKKGLNSFTIVALTKKGGVGSKSFKLIFSPYHKGPNITLISPKNGLGGVKPGQPLLVEGTIDDSSITSATLFLNKETIPLKVNNGVFKKKVRSPNNRINTFQVVAVRKDGIYAHSARHTVLADYSVDIPSLRPINPQPY